MEPRESESANWSESATGKKALGTLAFRPNHLLLRLLRLKGERECQECMCMLGGGSFKYFSSSMNMVVDWFTMACLLLVRFAQQCCNCARPVLDTR